MREKTKFERAYPKWLIADSADDRVFVIHLHWPRFIGEVVEHGIMGVPSITSEFLDQPDGLDTAALAALLSEAGDFYTREIE